MTGINRWLYQEQQEDHWVSMLEWMAHCPRRDTCAEWCLEERTCPYIVDSAEVLEDGQYVER